jgi:agmatinase
MSNPLNREYNAFMACDADWQDAQIVLFGAPYDSTTSNRPGARFGPRAVRAESFGLETFSPYQNRDLADCAVFDSGDLELPFGDSSRALAIVEARAAAILDAGKLPLLVGGEHLVTLGALTAAAKAHPNLHLIQFDAHADLRDHYLGVSLSHACVIRRCWDLLGDGRIAQFGIRSGERAEFEWSERHTHLTRFDFSGLEELVDSLIADNTPVYLTIDLDVLDPAVFPGTGTPEAGGVSFPDLLAAVLTVCRANVVACDINELSPPLDPSGVSTATACKVLRELLLALSR